MNSYDLSRNFWNWAFDNPEKISPNHAAVYFFAIEHCNRLGWKKKFGFPSQMTMDAIGIKKHSTYIRYFNDLVEFGFFELIQKSMNQYSSNIISLTSALPKKGEAMDKAISNHTAKQKEYKQTNKPINKEQVLKAFDYFWEHYPKKVAKGKCKEKWMRLKELEQKQIVRTIKDFIAYKPFEDYTHPNPMTYLNQSRWEDELPKKKEKVIIHPSEYLGL